MYALINVRGSSIGTLGGDVVRIDSGVVVGRMSSTTPTDTERTFWVSWVGGPIETESIKIDSPFDLAPVWRFIQALEVEHAHG